MDIIWTDKASEDLESLISYYLRVAGKRTANSVKNKILEEVKRLSFFPFIGPAMLEYDRLYRYCVVRPHYKVIYRVTERNIRINNITTL